MKIEVKNCARCGEDHVMNFEKLKEAIRIGNQVYSHWGLCPNRNEPVLMYFGEEKNEDK